MFPCRLPPNSRTRKRTVPPSPTMADQTKSASSMIRFDPQRHRCLDLAGEWTNAIGIKFVRIQAGEFLDGNNQRPGRSVEATFS